MKKKIGLCLFIIVFLIISIPRPVSVKAETVRDLLDELDALEAEANQNKADRALTQEQIDEANATINQITQTITDSKHEIENLSIEIEELNQSIKDKNEEIKKLMNFLQISNGENAYLEYAFGAQDFTDFIYRMAVSEQLASYNDQLMTDYNQMIEDNKQKQKDLEAQQVELANQQDALNQELDRLGEKMSTLSDTAITIEEDIALQREIIQMYRDLGCGDNDDIDVCGKNMLPPGTSFLRPMVSGYVTSEWGSRWGSFHEGIDLSTYPTSNVPVYSSAVGIVAAIRRNQPCGGNMVLVHHNINGQTYTAMYAHLRSINVTQGQRVNQNTQIGVMGGDPNIETFDYCSTGPHLHFTISTGLYATDYSSWDTLIARSINPRSVCNFPALGVAFNNRSIEY